MIHKIKALHDNGQGLSIRAIGEQLGVSRNTVRKYLRMDESSIAGQLDDPSRTKRLDDHSACIIDLLEQYPKLSAVKLARKLQAKVGPLPASARSVRRYVRILKEQVPCARHRYYEPIMNDLPGVQCQVDPGELRGVMIADQPCTVYFVVFVLSFSRLMHVGISFRPLDTQTFIELHDEAFRYFGGIPEECVYDQTSLVVIDEQYRELKVNPRFLHYVTAAGYRLHACEGYDPESKGKVEAGVKYVKQDCLYGDRFSDRQSLRQHIQGWLEEVANARIHGTTGRQPRALFEQEERAKLRPYLTPTCVGRPLHGIDSRQVDKTGLIAWKANKYSVPMRWQQARVGVRQTENTLLISELNQGELIASHLLCEDKGQIIKNRHHYRDPLQRIIDLEVQIAEQVGEDIATVLCEQLKRTEPKIYKDQLVATRTLLRKHAPVDIELIAQLAQRPRLSATRLRDYLEATHAAVQRERNPEPIPINTSALDLSAYHRVGRSTGQEVTHESA